ncbi:NPLOC4 [Cordylochernes scorpioides]|uniref:NPLOC4 n=1 Tax=Cordylochernes scorpioides TaxID=51811 RepID=A0ABY6K1I9_9ARAC|nr:NPLOC4 [Cordylochernes scorpioides]
MNLRKDPSPGIQRSCVCTHVRDGSNGICFHVRNSLKLQAKSDFHQIHVVQAMIIMMGRSSRLLLLLLSPLLWLQVQTAFELPSVYSFSVFTDKSKQKEILNLERKRLKAYNLNAHGTSHDNHVQAGIEQQTVTGQINMGVTQVTAEASTVPDVVSNPELLFGMHVFPTPFAEVLIKRVEFVQGYDVCRHGDMVYLAYSNSHKVEDTAQTTLAAVPTGQDTLPPSTAQPTPLQLDEVDLQLYRMDGSIKRPRDERLCRHGDKGRCIHCIPLETMLMLNVCLQPYDENYLKEQNIKHLSFHAYLRKLAGGIDRGKFTALEYERCRIKESCKEHPPWPKAFCIKCQPSAITLNRQTYRHVDNVAFENPSMVDRFLDYWRVTGHQRLGILYGHYEVHKDVPLGIKACVAAIYEPPQESSKNQLVLRADERQELVDWVASQLGLRRVGWIFTDLEALDLQRATVKHFRGPDTYFLSADECILAGHMQNLHTNICREAAEGQFGSKFVTVCVTGDKENQVHMEGYQVSNQCMALVRDKCLIPTRDAPELGYIRESTPEQYVPDVYYKGKDTYNNEVTQLARPFPIEYLLVDVPASMPVTPHYTFHAASNIKPFPVENRMVEGHIQDFSALATYLRQFPGDQFLQSMSDFHVLIYIAQMDMLPLKDHMGPLLEAVRNKNSEAALSWARTEHWATVEELLSAQVHLVKAMIIMVDRRSQLLLLTRGTGHDNHGG